MDVMFCPRCFVVGNLLDVCGSSHDLALVVNTLGEVAVVYPLCSRVVRLQLGLSYASLVVAGLAGMECVIRRLFSSLYFTLK